MDELIALSSLSMSPVAFSLMASDLRRASWAWLRAAASCSRDIRDCSSSAWTSEEQAGTRSQERQKKEEGEDSSKIQYTLWSCSDERLRTPSFSITLRMATFRSYLTVASCTTILRANQA
jgi:hypothetical protein